MKIRRKRFVGCGVRFPRYQKIGWSEGSLAAGIFDPEDTSAEGDTRDPTRIGAKGKEGAEDPAPSLPGALRIVTEQAWRLRRRLYVEARRWWPRRRPHGSPWQSHHC